MMIPPTIMMVVALMISASPPPPAVPAIYVFRKQLKFARVHNISTVMNARVVGLITSQL